jgi:hypothetical protein
MNHEFGMMNCHLSLIRDSDNRGGYPLPSFAGTSLAGMTTRRPEALGRRAMLGTRALNIVIPAKAGIHCAALH